MKLWPFGKKASAVSIPLEELPVPTGLNGFFIPEISKCSMTEITGCIRCPCGENAFRAFSSEEPGLRYRLKCPACGRDIQLFDGRQNGWDALVCGDVPEMDGIADKSEVCDKCGGDRFHTDVWIEPVERDDFVSEVPAGLTADDWVNAYGWFAASLTCCRCGRKIRSWADVETA